MGQSKSFTSRRARHTIVGNWKMNHKLADVAGFFKNACDASYSWDCEAWIAPQFIHIPDALSLATNSKIKIGAQNCSDKTAGALTGEISPACLKDLGAHFVIIGHSERRQIFHETHDQLQAKAKLALELGLHVIFCVGETLSDRESGNTFKVLEKQIAESLAPLVQGASKELFSKLLIAYEPVWAIGTGKVATGSEANEAHHFIRQTLLKYNLPGIDLPILYGGSVKKDNIDELLSFEDIDGSLVGGASLLASDFAGLCQKALRGQNKRM